MRWGKILLRQTSQHTMSIRNQVERLAKLQSEGLRRGVIKCGRSTTLGLKNELIKTKTLDECFTAKR